MTPWSLLVVNAYSPPIQIVHCSCIILIYMCMENYVYTYNMYMRIPFWWELTSSKQPLSRDRWLVWPHHDSSQCWHTECARRHGVLHMHAKLYMYIHVYTYLPSHTIACSVFNRLFIKAKCVASAVMTLCGEHNLMKPHSSKGPA